MVNGKKALVTGSTSGIGLCIATTLAQHGADVVINGFGDVAGALKHFHGSDSKVLYHPADLRNAKEIESMMDFARSELGGIDILVNNAGIQHVSPIETFPTEQWDAILAINLSATFHTMRLAIPIMKSNNWGRIINIASVHGLVASVNKSAYVASKHGLVGLTKVAALELATTRITANAICPGWVHTDLVQKQIDTRAKMEAVSTEQAAQRLLAEKQPSLQFTTPEQIAELALFLCSPSADNIRGSTFNLDGGWTAQ
ncbi:MAG: 3-hydroxybutyrate dehydrogenase [Pirellula sp.]|jgi:3-hydroxybutyrate dehydrogenase